MLFGHEEIDHLAHGERGAGVQVIVEAHGDVVRGGFVGRKDMHLKWPRARTPPHYITMGLNDELNACATLAVREMIDFLVTEKHLSRDDAYMLSSVAADLHITELVDGNKGVHMMIPKSIFVSGAPH